MSSIKTVFKTGYFREDVSFVEIVASTYGGIVHLINQDEGSGMEVRNDCSNVIVGDYKEHKGSKLET